MNSNRDDLFAAADACFKIQKAIPSGGISKEVTEAIDYLFGKVLPKIENELVTSGLSENMDALNSAFKGQLSSMATEYNYTIINK